MRECGPQISSPWAEAIQVALGKKAGALGETSVQPLGHHPWVTLGHCLRPSKSHFLISKVKVALRSPGSIARCAWTQTLPQLQTSCRTREVDSILWATESFLKLGVPQGPDAQGG